MRISHNIPALQTAASLTKTSKKLDKATRNMTTGYKINSAKDDAASMAISNKLRTQVRGLTTASQNALDGISLIQTAEGALNEIQNMLQRIRELTVQAANGIYGVAVGDNDKEKMFMEIEQLLSEITDTAKKTEFNKIKVLSGELLQITNEDFYGIDAKDFRSRGLVLQIGPNKSMEMYATLDKITASSLARLKDPADPPAYPDGFLRDAYGNTIGLDQRLNFRRTDAIGREVWDSNEPPEWYTDPANASINFPPPFYLSTAGGDSNASDLNISKSIEIVDEAIADVSNIRAYLGAIQNRLEHTVLSLDNNAQNTEESRSRIEDTDMAYESIIYSSSQVLSQAAIAILAQANARPNQILQLMR